MHTTIPISSSKNIKFDIESNLIPSIKIFEVAVKKGVMKIIFISSGGTIYGNVDNHNSIKEDLKTEPICSYGIVKLAIEKYLKLITNKTDTKSIILRPSNPYGGISFHSSKLLGLINVSLLKIKSGELLTIWGDGSNVRDYIHINDLVNAIIKSIFIEQDQSYILNIGTGFGRSILEILDLIEKITLNKFNTRFIDSRKVDIHYNVLDIEKSLEYLRWEPLIKIEEGIKNTWNEINDL